MFKQLVTFRTVWTSVAAILSSVLWASPVYAIDIFGAGSYWQLEDADGVWGAGVGIAIPVFTPHVRIEARTYLFDNTEIDDDNDDELDILPIDVGMQLHLFPNGPLDPYVVSGASFLYADTDSERIDVDSNVGAYAGGGLQLRVTSFLSVYAEALYRMADVDVDGIINKDEVDISGVTGNIGAKLTF